MTFSRSSRIITLLVIDSLFFLLEIIVGYTVHSLALVADSFHMLNDVFSLLVALWAIKLAKQKTSSENYTYGWQRAEVLGALINGVFLLALCLSIFLEAIQRFFEPQMVSNPVLVLAVGSAGLASNILGLFLFHDHGHSHGGGGGGHSHGASGGDVEAEGGIAQEEHEGHDHSHGHVGDQDQPENDSGDIEAILPSTIVAREARSLSPVANGGSARSRRSRGRSIQRHFASPVTDIHVHPAMMRQEVMAAAVSEGEEGSCEEAVSETEDETTPLMVGNGKMKAENKKLSTVSGHSRADSKTWHRDHHHAKPKKATSGGHSHQNLNMRGVFLHVLGDALGNVGVIATALFIWKTDYEWRLYADPAISLIITVIIFSSALPLCKSASKILLQGVPKGISIEEVKEDIASVPGVESVHELHIWQLSDVKMIASLHIQIAFDPETDRGGRYMQLARAIRTCLHAYGIHSSTIQPEYTPKSSKPDGNNNNGQHSQLHPAAGSLTVNTAGRGTYGAVAGSRIGSRRGSKDSLEGSECLLECGDECGESKCCGPVAPEGADSHGGHGHGHAH